MSQDRPTVLLSSGYSHKTYLSQLKKRLVLLHTTEDKISSCSVLALNRETDSRRNGGGWKQSLLHFQHNVIRLREDKKMMGMGRSLPYKRQLALEWLLLCSKWCCHLCQVPKWLPAAQVSAGRGALRPGPWVTQQEAGWAGRL